ncbi:CHRD domain-containing protein [Natronolimnohabitans innermongolicus]|uniref:CHRD domain-containing protein n=1 Tax=Natronolimnohabitans innermongolicus JCM 12255 TaxID=1227499 RepID=L9XFZ9_9EURY|nr:CHRD domain-containing protein [Natronolimnohabitans innermongolicus]ELY60659.1 hypothetical protein C493_04261 [Natronolimnohabitans innermongolicus JCM 12255]
MVDDNPRLASDAANETGVQRRQLLALGAATAIGTGLGATTATASGFDAQEAPNESNGVFLAALTGGQQPEPVETDATGGAVFSLSEDGTELAYALLVSAIEDITQAHIHLGQEGVDGPAVAWLYPDPEADAPELLAGRFDGTLATGTITDAHLTGDLEGASLEELVEEIDDENAYVNVHTDANPDGEIRGQLFRVEDVADALVDDHPGVDPDVDDADEPDEEEPEPDRDDDLDDEPDEDDAEPDEPDEVIQFIDCYTVRIVGEFPEVVIFPLELIEPGEEPGEPDQYFVGAMGSFPVGPVEGERVIDMREELGDGVIISAVNVLDGEFTEGQAIYERIHPDRDECIGQLFIDAGVEVPEDPFGEVPATAPDEADDDGPDGDDDPDADPDADDPDVDDETPDQDPNGDDLPNGDSVSNDGEPAPENETDA